MHAARCELKHQPPLPKLLMADVNATSNDIEDLKDLIAEGWTDVGLRADWWGSLAAQPTCKAPNSTMPLNRRDFAFVCPAMLPYVAGFHIFWNDEYTVHAAVQVLLNFGSGPIETN